MYGKVSVIIPIYNVSKYLKKCLDSILNQTYSNIEVLMIDDGSEDDSSIIAKQYLFDNRFQYIYKENGGQSSARNLGLDKATGKYVCFIDSDDYLSQTFISTLISIIIKYKGDIAECAVARVWENGNIKLHYKRTDGITVFTDIKKYVSLSPFSMCNKIFKIDLFNGLRFPEGIKFEDFALAPQVYSRAKLIVSTNDILYYYLWRENSTTTKQKIQPDILKAFITLENTCFGKQNYDIMSCFFTRQVVGSLIWAMIQDHHLMPEVKLIMKEGENKYPKWIDSIYNYPCNTISKIWFKLINRRFFHLARIYSIAFTNARIFVHNIMLRSQKLKHRE